MQSLVTDASAACRFDFFSATTSVTVAGVITATASTVAVSLLTQHCCPRHHCRFRRCLCHNFWPLLLSLLPIKMFEFHVCWLGKILIFTSVMWCVLGRMQSTSQQRWLVKQILVCNKLRLFPYQFLCPTLHERRNYPELPKLSWITTFILICPHPPSPQTWSRSPVRNPEAASDCWPSLDPAHFLFLFFFEIFCVALLLPQHVVPNIGRLCYLMSISKQHVWYRTH